MSFRLKIVMPSHPRYLAVVRATVGELGLVYGLSQESCQGIILAIDEALANIIRHAYKNHYDQQIELNCQVEAGRLEFQTSRPGRTAGSGQDLRSALG